MEQYFFRNSERNGLGSAELCKRILICVLVYLMLPVAREANAQFETASVLGYVRDVSGQSVPGSTVKLINTATDVTVAVTTDSQGQYQFTDVHVGQYKIDAGASGFNEAVTDPFTVAVNARQRVDIALAPGNVTTTVTVSGAATQLESETSETGTVISPTEVQNLPLNGRATPILQCWRRGCGAILWKISPSPAAMRPLT